MQSMQRRITEEIEAAIKLRELEPVASNQYSNRGTIYGMNEYHESVITLDFDFQHGRATIGLMELGENTKVFRFVYTDGPQIRELLAAVRGPV